MVYETSYETGQKPFRPDLERGRWEKPTDYIFACFGLALKLDIFVASNAFFFEMGLFGMLPYYMYMVLYLVPIVIIHSFMGQFSSSGFISALRISPFFKGMGYISLILSTAFVIYYSLFAAVPILFILNSFRPTMPWSCESVLTWYNSTKRPSSVVCNITNSELEVSETGNETEFSLVREHLVPSVLYFNEHFEALPGNHFFFGSRSQDYELSWHIVGYFVLVWLIIAGIFYTCSETAKFGRLLRYMVCGTMILLVVCALRFLFLPGALDGLIHYVTPRMDSMFYGAISMPIMMLQALGAGWGSVILLSSFNGFRTNIISYSWIVSFGQSFIYILFGLVTFTLDNYYLRSIDQNSFISYMDEHWMLYLSGASALSTLEWPNFWTILYYLMMLMATLIVLITQIFTILKSLFDEFEFLRLYKREVTFGLLGALSCCSFFFCTNHGILNFTVLSIEGIFSNSLLHLLLILVVLWMYGRQRFQRDIEFMLGQPFASWKIFILRFIAPIMLLWLLVMSAVISFLEHIYSSAALLIFSLVLMIIPLMALPGYGAYTMWLGTGTLGVRFRRACRPTDWYPLETEDRQKYEEAMGTTDLTHQLYEVTEEVN